MTCLNHVCAKCAKMTATEYKLMKLLTKANGGRGTLGSHHDICGKSIDRVKLMEKLDKLEEKLESQLNEEKVMNIVKAVMKSDHVCEGDKKNLPSYACVVRNNTEEKNAFTTT